MIGRALRLAALVGAAAAGAHPAAAASDLSLGADIAAQRCGRCHAIGLTGESPRAEAPPFRLIGGRYPVADLLDALSQGATPSHTGMPRFKLPRRETQALTQYVLSLQMGVAETR